MAAERAERGEPDLHPESVVRRWFGLQVALSARPPAYTWHAGRHAPALPTLWDRVPVVDDMIVRRSSRTAAFWRLRRAAILLLLTGPAAAAIAPTVAHAGGERASYRTQTLPSGGAIRASAPEIVGSAASLRNTGSASAEPSSGPRGTAARRTTASRRATRIDLKADARFSLAALRWSTAQPLTGRMRAQRTDGSWTDWTDLESDTVGDDGVVEGGDPRAAAAAHRRTAVIGRQGSTEPIWTGPARRLVVELTSPRPKGLRAAFVDITGQLPAVKARAAARRDDLMAGIHPRADWDPNNECAPRTTAGFGSVQAVTVHHTAGSNDYTEAQVPAVMLAICKYHRNANGWNDIGYNVLVDRYGGAWEGRAGGLTNAVIGAHAQGFNSVAAGISMIGEYTSVAPPPAQVATVARVAAWKLAVAGAPRSGTVELESAGGSLARFRAGETAVLPRVMGHRDVGQTACPGNTGYTVLDGVRASVAAASPSIPPNLPLPAPTVAPTPAPTPKPVKITISTKRRLDVGASAVVTGTATQGATPLKGETVALQVGSGSKWITVDKAKTASNGKYRFTRKFSRSWTMRVARATGAETSAAVELVVVPKLTLTVPKRLQVGKATTLRGTIKPGRGPVVLTVERRASNGTYVKGKTQPVRLKGRTLTVKVTPHSLALYRFRLVYAGSDLAAAAKSPLGFGRAVRTSSTAGGASVG